MKLTKFLCHVLTIRNDGIHTLAYFHKDGVTSCKKIKKDCEEIKKDCDKKEKIKRDCDKKDCEKTSKVIG